MNILVLGGCGYVGTLLVNRLLENKNKVTVIDTQWFGNYLNNLVNLKVKKKDIRDLKNSDFKNIDIVVHLANIANDPAVELNETLSWDVNVLASINICKYAINNKIKKIIFASSGSVYGIKKERFVTEDLSLVPISTYNKTKMVAEEIFRRYQNYFELFIIRPATVCGYSPRMRLDLSVNMLTMQALKNKKITVFGGTQIRPNIHINDLIELYIFLIKNKIKPGTYNAGFENMKIIDIAKMIQNEIKSEIVISKSNDPRSYRLDSTKILNLGFIKKFSVKDAILDLKDKFENKKLQDKEYFYTVKWMKKNKI